MKVEIKYKNQYGNDVYYPVNDTAKSFAKIAGTKTLTAHTLNIIKEMGIEISILSPEVRNKW